LEGVQRRALKMKMRTDAEIRRDWPEQETNDFKAQKLLLEVLLDVRRLLRNPLFRSKLKGKEEGA
tara:strand:+ start:3825 stop:4019 length:195 start_codon:yes stop_codon:yes gene_type:complete